MPDGKSNNFGAELDSLSFEDRLTWLASQHTKDPLNEQKFRARSFDLIRGTLLNEWQEEKMPTFDIIRNIHKTHFEGKEQYLLNPLEAKNLLSRGAPKIAGVLRGTHGLKNYAFIGHFEVLCAGPEDVPALTEKLSDVADTLFPYNEENPQVNSDSIFSYLSYIQLAFMMIHPFYEGNGRTSEDLLLALWKRRPDLSQSIRYIRPDGRLGSPSSRNAHILDAAIELRNQFVYGMGVPKNTSIYDTIDVQDSLEKLYPNESPQFRADLYLTAYATELSQFIEQIPDLASSQQNVYLENLALNLETFPRTYNFSSQK